MFDDLIIDEDNYEQIKTYLEHTITRIETKISDYLKVLEELDNSGISAEKLSVNLDNYQKIIKSLEGKLSIITEDIKVNISSYLESIELEEQIN